MTRDVDRLDDTGDTLREFCRELLQILSRIQADLETVTEMDQATLLSLCGEDTPDLITLIQTQLDKLHSGLENCIGASLPSSALGDTQVILGMIRHDLLTPLESIRSVAFLLPPPPSSESQTDIVKSVTQLVEGIDEFHHHLLATRIDPPL